MSRIKKVKPFDEGITESDCRRYFRQLLSAVWYCHNIVHIFHRDIKPDNLLIDADGNVKLTDFGVSSSFESKQKRQGSKLKDNRGTQDYWAPEAFGDSSGCNGEAADIWACAVTLYYMVYGKLPFEFKGRHELGSFNDLVKQD